MKKFLLILFLSLAVLSTTACGGGDEDTQPIPTQPVPTEPVPTEPGENNQTVTSMKMNITVGSHMVTATMEDNAAARDLLSRLPLEVTLVDFNNTTEKIFYPDPALTTEGVARGCAPTPGDITIYAPWGNVAIFCKNWSHSNDLIKIGHIDNNGIEALNIEGDIIVKLERQ